MPIITIQATPGAFTADSKADIVRTLTETSIELESLPEANRRRCIVIWEDLTEVYVGGEPAGPLTRTLLLTFVTSDGVLDPVRRERFSAAVQAVAEKQPADDRPVVTAVLFYDVPEGRWGRNGTVARLPQIAAAAGFTHLTEIAG
ncbi:hypothetical protein GCM10029964_093820 [Kibdelosporangium lantanae]